MTAHLTPEQALEDVHAQCAAAGMDPAVVLRAARWVGYGMAVGQLFAQPVTIEVTHLGGANGRTHGATVYVPVEALR